MFDRIATTNPKLWNSKEFAGIETLRQQLTNLTGETGIDDVQSLAALFNSLIIAVYAASGGDKEATTKIVMGFAWAQCSAVFSAMQANHEEGVRAYWDQIAEQFTQQLQKLPSYAQQPNAARVKGFSAKVGRLVTETVPGWFTRVASFFPAYITELAMKYPELAEVAKRAGYRGLEGLVIGGAPGAASGAALGAMEGLESASRGQAGGGTLDQLTGSGATAAPTAGNAVTGGAANPDRKSVV